MIRITELYFRFNFGGGNKGDMGDLMERFVFMCGFVFRLLGIVSEKFTMLIMQFFYFKYLATN